MDSEESEPMVNERQTKGSTIEMTVASFHR